MFVTFKAMVDYDHFRQMAQMQQSVAGHHRLERRLFHGTRRCSIESICKNNFNLRYSGEHASRYGKGKLILAIIIHFDSTGFYPGHLGTKREIFILGVS